MSTSETLYTARLSSDWIERGRAQTIKCPVYRDGALAVPASGTVSVFNAAGAAVVGAQAVTVASSVAEYTLSAGSTTGESLGLGWRIEWTLALPDSVSHVFRVDAGLVRRRLYPVISDVDLKRRHSDLDDLRSADASSYQDFLDEAWQDLIDRLSARGSLPFLIMEPGALRRCHLFHTLQLIFLDFSSSAGDGRYLDLAEQYRKEFEDAWGQLRFSYDYDHDGEADKDGQEKKSPHAVVWLGGSRWHR